MIEMVNKMIVKDSCLKHPSVTMQAAQAFIRARSHDHDRPQGPP
jgi:hypothetical protein